MARTSDDEIFLRELPPDGTPIGNYRLIQQLGWNEDRYWRVRARLVDDGLVVLGKGRGGAVRLVVAASTSPPVPPTVTGGITRELDLYEPLGETLLQQWRLERRLDNFIVEITALQGRRSTGGVWTRPDLTGISVRRFAHVPGVHFDVWTFEVKPIWELNVVGVAEAAAHARFATRSYVFYHLETADGGPELDVCVDEARRFGVGVVSFVDPRDFKTWEVHLDAERHEPDPALLDEFIATQMSDETKHELQRWLRS
jgi:hypothetical protein